MKKPSILVCVLCIHLLSCGRLFRHDYASKFLKTAKCLGANASISGWDLLTLIDAIVNFNVNSMAKISEIFYNNAQIVRQCYVQEKKSFYGVTLNNGLKEKFYFSEFISCLKKETEDLKIVKKIFEAFSKKDYFTVITEYSKIGQKGSNLLQKCKLDAKK